MNRQIRTALPASVHAALLHLRVETGMTLGELLTQAALVLLHQAGRGDGLALPVPLRAFVGSTTSARLPAPGPPPDSAERLAP